MSPAPAWSAERERRLEQLWADKTLSAKAISQLMGISKNAVIGKVHRLALAPRVETPGSPPVANPFPDRGCLWPIGHPGEKGFHFCCGRPFPGKPYCAEHAARAYQQITPPAPKLPRRA